MIPLSVSGIFNLIGHDTSSEFLVRVSYMELYNEELKDLLRPDGPGSAAELVVLFPNDIAHSLTENFAHLLRKAENCQR